ncbi:hypothetical protein NGA_0188501 [Nannochloropsis gaditana CCMP526]|uniref:uncharacterized protein n=1 Tax=Nannochloropsis gaditana (strain CCMP526) TaxID=1093141 RepID=UPI00029F6D2E|nr:hypothetical protein NGA_0188501 [Nannochloropsis gaditana CCMP526]XP_005855596.1 hypothetical protein NGA_0188502 [Nannochloropsis gaditana CCMP526]EKU20759.1 hypothetical protein NGA_0188502 [Nannochloropsis gaditana CCMP526]EKU22181.1 hypothetical protein NGA_0188501 [Nannochloropsis gaditana CCMP526]|eukprot:XP_005854180.1 hypothetical protein NGA_0188501 [Nannochloropsis gaditana CCMP526]
MKFATSSLILASAVIISAIKHGAVSFVSLLSQMKSCIGHPKSSKHGNSTDVRLVRSRIIPNTWRPKLRSNITGSTNFMSVPTTGLVVLKDYKIINKFRIGKRYPSGTVISFYVFVDYGGSPLLDEVFDVYVR